MNLTAGAQRQYDAETRNFNGLFLRLGGGMKSKAASGHMSAVRRVLDWVKTGATGILSRPKPKPILFAPSQVHFQTVSEYLRDGFCGLSGPFGLSSPALDILWGVPDHLKPPALSTLEDEERRTGTRPKELQEFYNAVEDLVFDLNDVYIGLCEKAYSELLYEHFPEERCHIDAYYGPSAAP